MITATFATEITLEDILEALQRVPPERLPDILQFIEFIEYQAAQADASEDEALWAAVEANQAYKQQHPDEESERFKSGADFLKAGADLYFDDEQAVEIEYVGPKPPDLYDRLGLARPSTATDE